MNRKSFVAVWGAMALAGAAGAADPAGPKQVVELRTYTFATEAKLKTFEEFLAKSMIPALNRAGVTPVGAFRLMKADNPKLNLESDALTLQVLLPHASIEGALTLAGKLAADKAYAEAVQAVLGTPMKDPVYARFESQLLLGFTQCPKVEVPTRAETRVIQLRIYESHNDEHALRKIEMFNEGGEIGIFRRTGLNPVFFGQSIAGTKLPNLTYILAFESPAAQEAAWAAFMKDPDWTKLKADSKYADTVSNITNLILRPVAGSQI